MKIYKAKNGKYYGKITKILDPSRQKKKCTECDGSKKDQSILGLIIIEGLSKDGAEYEDGTILDPDDGKEYSCAVWLDSNGDLKVRGYWGWFFRTQTWKRVNS